jgi:hypothetical protein
MAATLSRNTQNAGFAEQQQSRAAQFDLAKSMQDYVDVLKRAVHK